MSRVRGKWVCARCSGTGHVTMARYGDGRSTERTYTVVCPTCKGVIAAGERYETVIVKKEGDSQS